MTPVDEKELEEALIELTEPEPDNGAPTPPLEKDDNFWTVIDAARTLSRILPELRKMIEAREKATQGKWIAASEISSVVGLPVVNQDGGSVLKATTVPKTHPAAEPFNTIALHNAAFAATAANSTQAISEILKG